MTRRLHKLARHSQISYDTLIRSLSQHPSRNIRFPTPLPNELQIASSKQPEPCKRIRENTNNNKAYHTKNYQDPTTSIIHLSRFIEPNKKDELIIQYYTFYWRITFLLLSFKYYNLVERKQHTNTFYLKLF